MPKIKVPLEPKDRTLMDLGYRVALLRQKKGITQYRLGLLSRTTQSYISDLEMGRRNPSVLVLARIAKALDCELSDLFYFDEGEQL